MLGGTHDCTQVRTSCLLVCVSARLVAFLTYAGIGMNAVFSARKARRLGLTSLSCLPYSPRGSGSGLYCRSGALHSYLADAGQSRASSS
ncbi:hypothetical protein C8T65DRAFT_627512, partial [Cerioporus squamosus]